MKFIQYILVFSIFLTACQKEDDTVQNPLTKDTPIGISGTIDGQPLPEGNYIGVGFEADTLPNDSILIGFSLIMLPKDSIGLPFMGITLGALGINIAEAGQPQPFISYFKTGDDVFTYSMQNDPGNAHYVKVSFIDENANYWLTSGDQSASLFSLTDLISYTENDTEDFVKFRLRAKFTLRLGSSNAVTKLVDISIVGIAMNLE